jgi:hypothetical protein
MNVNIRCGIAAGEGRLEGLTNYLHNLNKIANDPRYKGDLAVEINRVIGEIRITEKELDELRIEKSKKNGQG